MNKAWRVARGKKSISVIWKIVIVFSCICIVPMLAFISYIHAMASGEITANARNSLAQSLVKTRNTVENKMDVIESSCSELVGNNILTQFLDSNFSYTGDEIIYFNRLVYPFFAVRKSLLPEVYSIWIYTDNVTLPLSWQEDTGIAPMEYYPFRVEEKPESIDYWWNLYTGEETPFETRKNEAPRTAFSFSRVIRSPYTASPMGVVDYRIAVEALFEAVTDAQNNTSGTLYLVLDDGTILFSGREDAAGRRLSDLYDNGDGLFTQTAPGQYGGENASYIIGSEVLPRLQCTLVSVRSLTDIQSELQRVTTGMVWGLIGAVAVVILLVSGATFGIMTRVRKLVMAMHRVDEGDYSISVDPGPEDEFGWLIVTFNGMIRKINTLINNVYRIQIREKEAQLRALEAQVNPHFLYNTLTSIACTAKENNDTDTYRMALSLGKFYRLGLSNKAELITVSDELEYLNMYLTIQKIRFRNRINYLFDIDEQYLRCKLIRNVLQPLVENAISHGLNDKMDGGTVTIRMTRGEAENLLFEVRDNGVGMDPGQLRMLNDGVFPGDAASGYGLKNVNDRLQIYYGDDYRLSAASRAGEGTCIYVRIPIRW